VYFKYLLYLCNVKIKTINTMALTTSFIAEQFALINKKYFNNELLTPRFEITHVKSYLGQYHWKYSYDSRIFADSVIRISDMFDRNDADITNTIAHEMIHLYIRQNKIRDTRPHHGRVFNSIADRLNREGGFHIARTDSVEGCGLRNKNQRTEYIIAAFYSGTSGKYFQFRINNKYLNYYLTRFERYPEHYKNVIVYKSTDDKKFAHYTQCYKSVRGYYISKKEYDKIVETENVIHRFVTLSIKHTAA